ncbi:MAG: DNA polymerase III subunit alpha [Firmicutes bacterium]|nr:DNA polymerase III subunit alpha [Bacillota bacterium]
MNKPFIHLHNHTEYSLLDGAATIQKLVAKAKAEGAPAVAITDHGNMYGVIKFYQECKKKNINPIIGSEFYVCKDMDDKENKGADYEKPCHLVLIAKDYNGYRNLSRLSSHSFVDGFYRHPRIDLNLLKKYSEGLICLSGCLQGAVPRYLISGDYNLAKECALLHKAMFKEGDYYIELQEHGIRDLKDGALMSQAEINRELYKLSLDIGVKCVATNDVHYMNREDAEMHEILLCVQTGSFYDDERRMKFTGKEFYYKSREEMEEVLGEYPDSLDTPYEIHQKCNVEFVFNEYKLPEYKAEGEMLKEVESFGLSMKKEGWSKEFLRELSYANLKKRYGEISPQIRERAETELEVIISMGFADYYLIAWDFIKYAKDNDIPVGPGRGSGVGSLIAYALNITDIDPIKYDLVFERFLNKDRTSMPDLDIDFCSDKRADVIAYVRDKYTSSFVSNIITFGAMKKKNAIRDVARAYRLPFADSTRLTESMGDLGAKKEIELIKGDPKSKVNITIEALLNPVDPKLETDLKTLYDESEEFRRIINVAKQIEDMPRQAGVHPAGIVIYKDPAIESIPLAISKDKEPITQYDMTEVEKLGLLKMDFLALLTLTDIKTAHDYVLARTGVNVDFKKIGYNDLSVYAMIGAGNTDAVFQLESGGMKETMRDLNPQGIEDIIAGVAMYRPGPMDNIPLLVKNKSAPDKIDYGHPLLKPILEPTYGIIVYQEQAMLITRALAGYSMTDADKFRAIMGKKQTDKIPAEREKFMNGCAERGINEGLAQKVFSDIQKFAQYAFNKSHAAAYAFLAYETAYYKHYYPVEFMTAVLNNRMNKPDDTKKYMRVLKEMRIPLLPPDINKSDSNFTPEEGKVVRYGLSCIKHVGKAAVNAILGIRQNGEFKDLYDFLYRTFDTRLNSGMIESLIRGGAMDSFGMTRATLLANYAQIIVFIEKRKKHEDTNQLDMFSMFGEEENSEYKYRILPELPLKEKLVQEKEVAGAYLTGHPLQGHEEDFKAFNFNTSMLPRAKSDNEEEEEDGETFQETNPLKEGMEVFTGGLISEVEFKRTKDGKEFCVILLEDMHGTIESAIFSRTLINVRANLFKDNLVKVRGKLGINRETFKITVNDLMPWELELKEHKSEEKAPKAKALYIQITKNNVKQLDRIDEILSAHKDLFGVAVRIYDQSTKELFEHPTKIKSPDTAIRELAGIVGIDNLKLVQ